jgi:hypothetical protein
MQHIADALSDLKVGDPIIFQNMELFPLLGGQNGAAEYLTLDEALAEMIAEVTEVSDSGSIPELRFLNKGDKAVLLLDGEELVGAKQNRVLNLSILAPAKDAIVIPVSCVESGRWRHDTASFMAADRTQFASGRAKKSAHVSMSLREFKSRRSDQSEIWNDIEAKASRFRSHSPTGAMSDMYDQQRSSIDRFVEHFSAADQQVGAVFAINGKVVGVDVFDNSGTYAKLSSKLVRSYALDALDIHCSEKNSISSETVEVFFHDIEAADAASFPAVGLGDDLRLTGSGITGGALVVDGEYVHFWAFPRSRGEKKGRGM